MAELNTVNVIDLKDAATYNIASVKSYPDNPDGNKEAEATFREWVGECADPENPPTEADISAALANGIFEIGEGAILLVHST
jgi:hypothetical protein